MVLALLLGACSGQPRSADLALVGATLFDDSGGPPLADAVVLVRRGRLISDCRCGYTTVLGARDVDIEPQ